MTQSKSEKLMESHIKQQKELQRQTEEELKRLTQLNDELRKKAQQTLHNL